MSFTSGDILSVPGQLFESERWFFKQAAEEIATRFASPTIVNIGIWLGASCYCFRAGAPGARLVGIDVMGTYAIELAHPNLLKHLNMEVVKRNSNFVEWNDRIHLLFIDGGHELDVVWGDYVRYGTCVVQGGCMIFHDSGRPEVVDVVNRIRKKVGLWEEFNRGAEKIGSLAAFRRLE